MRFWRIIHSIRNKQLKYWEEPSIKAAFIHARLSTAHYSKSFHISTLMLPAERRWATFALYGFCRYADNLIDNPRRRSTAELVSEIACLNEELKVAYRMGESEHPIIKPFIFVAQKYGIPFDHPNDLLKGVRMDVEITRYDTFDDLYLFCYRVAGVVGLMMTHILGHKTDRAFEYAEKLGIAMQLTNILRDIQEDKNMGRIYLPQEELRQFGICEDDILRENFNSNFHKLMKFQVERAEHYYHAAAPGIPMLQTESQFAIHSAAQIYRGILKKIIERNYNPFLGRVYVPFAVKLAILMKEVARTRWNMLKEKF